VSFPDKRPPLDSFSVFPPLCRHTFSPDCLPRDIRVLQNCGFLSAFLLLRFFSLFSSPPFLLVFFFLFFLFQTVGFLPLILFPPMSCCLEHGFPPFFFRTGSPGASPWFSFLPHFLGLMPWIFASSQFFFFPSCENPVFQILS